MKIAITGATGFIGGYILRALAAKGHSLRALARPSSRRSVLDLVGAEVVIGDVGNEEALKKLVAGVDVVVHNVHCQDVKAAADPISYITANVCSGFWLLEHARQAHCRQFIFTSSGAVYGETFENMPLDERHPTIPTRIYGACKVSVEAMCAAYYHQFRMNTVCLRPVYVYGIAPKLEDSLWFDIVAEAIRGEHVETSRSGNVVSVETVAEAVALCAGNDAIAGQRYNLADCYVEWQSVVDLVKEIHGTASHFRRHAKAPTVLSAAAQRLGVRFPGVAGLERYLKDLSQRIEQTQAAHAEVTV